MDDQTLFYILGIALVILALVVSAIGIRDEGFPSTGLLRGVVPLFAVVVAATGVFAVRSARDEQAHRNAELAAEAAEEGGEPAEPVGEADEPGEAEEPAGGEAPSGERGGEAEGEPAGGGVSAAGGDQLFAQFGCASCHTLSQVGATGTVGPNLNLALEGKSSAFIEESIVDPNAEIAKGYDPNLMPATFAEQLTPDQLRTLVAFLAQAAGSQ